MIERPTRDRDAETAQISEVGEAHTAGRVLLAEDHIALGTVERPPAGHAPLQGPPHTGGQLGMPPANLLENRHHPQLGCHLQHRHDLALPHGGERVGTTAAARRLLLRRQPWIDFDPIGTGGRKSGFRRRRVALTRLHVQPRLAAPPPRPPAGDRVAGLGIVLAQWAGSCAAREPAGRIVGCAPPAGYARSFVAHPAETRCCG
jgi:hypothetical protein